MATPNATGTALLLLDLYTSRNPGRYLRASTLKGLVIHTADDLGTAGPDYKSGWGLINAKRAADLIMIATTNPAVLAISERQITTLAPSVTNSFYWDGVSPIRATLCWTDPAGASTTLTDSRTARLVNNLNLKLVAPDGTAHYPFIMPFVGTWTEASMSAAATTGVNNTDNVEQVLVSTPASAGEWKAVVSLSGILTGTSQAYSLLVSGSAAGPPRPLMVSPYIATHSTMALNVSGESFTPGATVSFFRSGENDRAAQAASAAAPTNIACTLDAFDMPRGTWGVRVTNNDGKVGELKNAITIAGIIKYEAFELPPQGWSTSANIGTTYWARTSAASHTAPTSWFASGPAVKNTDNLLSPSYAIPADVELLQLHFWHRYSMEPNDGGVLEISKDGGTTWLAIGAAGSGAAFIRGGYASTIGMPLGGSTKRAELAGSPAWNGNNGNAFSEVAVALDPAAYAGTALRVRWRLCTDAATASAGWYVDTFGVYAISPFTGSIMQLR